MVSPTAPFSAEETTTSPVAMPMRNSQVSYRHRDIAAWTSASMISSPARMARSASPSCASG